MKKIYLLLTLLCAYNFSQAQALANVTFEKLQDSPVGFIDVSVNLAFTGTPDAVGNCNFFFTVNPSVLGIPSTQSLGDLASPYTNSITDNGGGIYSYNIVLPTANNGTGSPVINTFSISVGILRFPLLAPPSGTTPLDIDEDFTEIFDDGDPAQPIQIPLGLSPTADIALPIKLRQFTVNKFGNERASDINWSSSSEINSAYFDIERSIDGYTFNAIGNVLAAGNSTTEQFYSILDRNLPTSRGSQDVFYYRLKMVDLDGKFEYSDVRSVRFDNDTDIEFNTYPNPTAGKVFVKMSTPDTDETEFTQALVYDLSGRLVIKKDVSTKGITEIDMNNLTNGSYNINISHNGTTYQNKVIKTN